MSLLSPSIRHFKTSSFVTMFWPFFMLACFGTARAYSKAAAYLLKEKEQAILKISSLIVLELFLRGVGGGGITMAVIVH